MGISFVKPPPEAALKKPEPAPEPVVKSKPTGKPALPKAFTDAPSLSDVLGALTKENGDGFVLRGSEVPDVLRYRTGVFEFDLATGGGIPRGRITILYGPESSGKTNVALNLIREVQQTETGDVVFVDLEGTFDKDWAVEFGIDLDRLIVLKPAFGEEAVDAVEAVLRTKDIALVVVDSIAVVVPAKEIEKSTETADVGTAAILMKRMVNKAVMALAYQARSGRFPAMLLLNQTRFKIGVMYGDPEIFPGGQTVKFLSSLTVRISATNEVDSKIHPTKPAWKKTKLRVKKAKIPINQAECEYSMAMVPAPDLGLMIGQTYSWNTVLNILRTEGKLTKLANGKYHLAGLPAGYPTEWQKLGNIEEQYLCDTEFAGVVQSIAIATFKDKGVLVAAEGAAK